MSIFSLAAIFGILLNTVGADLIVVKPTPVIDSLEDLAGDPQFANIKLFLMKDFWEHSALKGARTGTKERKLLDRIMSDANFSFVDSQEWKDEASYSSPKVSKFVDRALGEDTAGILLSWWAKFIPMLACFTREMEDLPKVKEFVQNSHVSKESFGGGTLNSLYSHTINPYMEN